MYINTYWEKERLKEFKGLAHAVVETGKSEIYSSLEIQGGADIAVWDQRLSTARSLPLLEEVSPFPLKLSTDGMRHTYIMEVNLLYSKSADSKWISSKTYLQRNI